MISEYINRILYCNIQKTKILYVAGFEPGTFEFLLTYLTIML